jgi:hypothetical protein
VAKRAALLLNGLCDSVFNHCASVILVLNPCDSLNQIDIVTCESYANDLVESICCCNLMIFIVESNCV